jgi:hypothetical protein
LCKYIGDYGHLFSKVSNLNVFGIELELLQWETGVLVSELL